MTNNRQRKLECGHPLLDVIMQADGAKFWRCEDGDLQAVKQGELMEDDRRPDVVIVGVGRSGTTNTGRIIHDHFNICMGHVFDRRKEPFNWNPGSECHVTLRYLRSMVKGDHTPEQVLHYWRQAHEEKHCTSILRGFKSTHIAAATWDEWLTIRPRLIIRTHRTRELTINSLHRWRGKCRDVWEQFHDDREEGMRKTVDQPDFPIKVVHVRYDASILSDEDLIDQLKPHVEALSQE